MREPVPYIGTFMALRPLLRHWLEQSDAFSALPDAPVVPHEPRRWTRSKARRLGDGGRVARAGLRVARQPAACD